MGEVVQETVGLSWLSEEKVWRQGDTGVVAGRSHGVLGCGRLATHTEASWGRGWGLDGRRGEGQGPLGVPGLLFVQLHLLCAPVDAVEGHEDVGVRAPADHVACPHCHFVKHLPREGQGPEPQPPHRPTQLASVAPGHKTRSPSSEKSPPQSTGRAGEQALALAGLRAPSPGELGLAEGLRCGGSTPEAEVHRVLPVQPPWEDSGL